MIHLLTHQYGSNEDCETCQPAVYVRLVVSRNEILLHIKNIGPIVLDESRASSAPGQLTPLLILSYTMLDALKSTARVAI